LATTLLAAAGVEPDQQYLPDGINLLPHLAERAPTVERKLFWRYKALWQRAARIGDWKYLKILDDTYLFNVVADPLERANIKDRHTDIYDRLVAEWNAWNATMLPEVEHSFMENFDGAHMPDRIGTRAVSLAPDPTLPGSAPPTAQRPSPFKAGDGGD
jgi:hypothetical protein